MKVLHYIPTIGKSGGGVSTYLQILTQSLGQFVNLHIVTRISKDDLALENCTIHYIEKSIKHPIRMKQQFYHLLEEIHPDVVHVNGCWMLQCSWIIFWAKKAGYPVVLSPHGMLEPWDIKKNYWTKKLPALILYQRKSIQISNIIVATSESEQKNLLSLGYNLNIQVVPNGIFTENIKCKESWEEKKQILFLALYRKNKGIDILMQAIAKLKANLLGWKVIIAGIESDYTIEDLNIMATNLGVSDLVNITGPLFGEDKWNAYKNSDIFILPTLNENFGIVIAESYLCGTPVITTKGAPWEIIEKYKCGWWIDRDVNSLINALLDFISTTSQERMQMGLTGAKLVKENFSSSIVAEKMIELYKSITK